jgi:hypothetical protein
VKGKRHGAIGNRLKVENLEDKKRAPFGSGFLVERKNKR